VIRYPDCLWLDSGHRVTRYVTALRALVVTRPSAGHRIHGIQDHLDQQRAIESTGLIGSSGVLISHHRCLGRGIRPSSRLQGLSE
ncbi:unnamed protein product, partial [Staurois parvus]